MICNSPAPSTRAASDSSSGIVRKNWRSRKIENASPKKLGTISGLSVPDPAQAHEDDVERHDRHLERQHQRGEHHDERDLAAAPPHPRRARRPPGRTTPRCRPSSARRSAWCSTCTGAAGPRWNTSRKLPHWNGLRPQRGGQRLLVGHQRGQHDEQERDQEDHRDERSGRRGSPTAVRNRRRRDGRRRRPDGGSAPALAVDRAGGGGGRSSNIPPW